MIEVLRARDNDVFVVLGPFNEHQMAAGNCPSYRKLHGEIAAWLLRNQISQFLPEPLPGALYADASHPPPLTAGYELLAKRPYGDTIFQKWISTK